MFYRQFFPSEVRFQVKPHVLDGFLRLQLTVDRNSEQSVAPQAFFSAVARTSSTPLRARELIVNIAIFASVVILQVREGQYKIRRRLLRSRNLLFSVLRC
jgi:hypothetical protein